MNLKIFILVLLFQISSEGLSKSDPPEYGMLFGYNFMPIRGNSFLEIGYIPYTFYQENHFPGHGMPEFTVGYGAPNVGVEVNTSENDIITGFKAGATYNRFHIATGIRFVIRIMPRAIFVCDRKSELIFCRFALCTAIIFRFHIRNLML
jgi:hypothetical protein